MIKGNYSAVNFIAAIKFAIISTKKKMKLYGIIKACRFFISFEKISFLVWIKIYIHKLHQAPS